MKKIVIVVPKINPLKETPEERKQRITSSGNFMVTKVAPSKKKLTKKQQRQKDRLEVKKHSCMN